MTMNRRLPPGPRYYLIASTPFAAAFGLIPATLYVHSGEDWSFDAWLLFLIAGAGLVLYVGAALAIRLLAGRHPRAAANVAVALFGLGLFALLAHVYAPIQVGPLDGSPLSSDEPLAYSLAEAALLAALAAVLVLLGRGKGLAPASLFAGLVLAVGTGYLAVAAANGEPGSPIAEVRAAAPPTPRGNVYHIVLDMMDTEALLYGVDRLALQDDLRGFDLFRNNISNYINTIPSSASYFSGTFYHSGSYEDWIAAWREDGLVATMADNGYTVWMYSPFPHWKDANTHNFVYHVDLYEESVGIENSRFYDFAQIWLASLAPNALTNEALGAAGALQDAALELIAGTDLLSVSEGVEPYASTLLLRRLRADEDRRTANGHYVYAHAVLPHGPEVMDRDCRYAGRPPRGRSPSEVRRDFLGQAECGLALVADFLDRLKELGRYDPATIVLHADNGHWTAFPADDAGRAARTLDKPDIHLLSWVHGALMVKPPYAGHPLRVLDAPTQLVDVFPTLLDILDLPPPGYPLHGRSVYAPGADEPRDARFGFDPVTPHGPDIVEIRIDDQTSPATSGLTVVGPATDPNLWRPEIRDRSDSR